MISVLILTYNEELNLPSCLDSVRAWSDDIIVFDSFSTDRTVEIAKQYGCRVFQRKFDNEASQRGESLKLPFKYPWVYNPDADEVTPADMRDELLAIVADSHRREVAYRCRFRVMFMGRWIKHSSLYPTWVVRLFRPDKLRFEREINLRYVIDGPEGKMKTHFDHYTFRKGIHAWVQKHNAYSTAEAKEGLKVRAGKASLSGLFSLNPVRRRATLKDIAFRLPFRSFFIFCYLMFARLGVLDGPAGWMYCRMRASYEFMISLKITESEFRQRGEAI
jgi:glycosyltransferase involved in cell wall biosynthesis